MDSIIGKKTYVRLSVWDRERENMCVCVFENVCAHESVWASVCACVKLYAHENAYACVFECACVKEKEREYERKLFFLTRFVDGIIKFPWNRGGEREDWFILFGSGGLKKSPFIERILVKMTIRQGEGGVAERIRVRPSQISSLLHFIKNTSLRGRLPINSLRSQ